MRILIAGAGGMVGSRVAAQLEHDGHEVVRLVRGPEPVDGQPTWEPDAGRIGTAALEGFDAVVDLASMSWSGRWNRRFRERIRANRIDSYRLLGDALAHLRVRPRVFVCASGMGIYADAGDEPIAEDGAFGSDFLGRLQQDGEAATSGASAAGIRVVHLRLPMVVGGPGLSDRLAQLRRFGDGRQWTSWIALTDVANVGRHVLATDAIAGGINTCSPNPLTNAEFVVVASSVTGRRAGFAIPAFVLRLAMGDAADGLILASRRMQPARLLETGFRFELPELGDALRYELGHAQGAAFRPSRTARISP